MLSAYTDIGFLPATKNVEAKNESLYNKWIEIYKAIQNPLILFTNKRATGERLIELRKSTPYPTMVSDWSTKS